VKQAKPTGDQTVYEALRRVVVALELARKLTLTPKACK